MEAFTIPVKVYYKDTDCGGVVYYANYLRYLEMARTEFMESKGVSMKALMDRGIYFVVKEVHIEYKSPGRYGDILLIDTLLKEKGYTYLVFSHRVRRKETDEVLATGEVKIVAVNARLRPLRMPEEIEKAI